MESTTAAWAVIHQAPAHVIWAHGWGRTHADFRLLAGSLERAAHHTLIDFPGFGESPRPETDWDTAAYADGHLQVMGATLLQPEDCVVVFSNSGRSRDLLDATELARQQKATTVAITASGSPLAAAADIHIAADHPESYEEYSPMVSRLLHLLIIDVLVTCVALRIGSSLQPILQQMKENLRNKRYA